MRKFLSFLLWGWQAVASGKPVRWNDRIGRRVKWRHRTFYPPWRNVEHGEGGQRACRLESRRLALD